jgi:hypothetical protein
VAAVRLVKDGDDDVAPGGEFGVIEAGLALVLGLGELLQGSEVDPARDLIRQLLSQLGAALDLHWLLRQQPARGDPWKSWPCGVRQVRLVVREQTLFVQAFVCRQPDALR